MTQNMLAVVDHNRLFTFVYPGWEGSAHDGRVLTAARLLKTPLRCPPNRYYLADAGYTNTPTTLVPYRGVRYHLRETEEAQMRPRNAKELFNLRHSSLRNVVERTFGIFKNRFQIFSTAPPFSKKTQNKLLYACTALHNFLTITGQPGEEALYLAPFELNNFNNFEGGELGVEIVEAPRTGGDTSGGMNERRDEMAAEMYRAYVEYNRRNPNKRTRLRQ